MAYETIIYEKKGRIAYVTLNRPESLNAMNDLMRIELYDVWQEVMRDDDVWVVVLTGAGRGFCTGPDVKEDARVYETGEVRKRAPGGFRGFPDSEEMDKPIVCAINGICAGGGLIWILASDITICSENVEFLDANVTVGRLPVPETITVVGHLPFGLAWRMLLMGTKERMSAQRAYEVGLVSEVVSQDKLMERATEIAQAVLEQAPLAVRGLKRTMKKGFLEMPYTGSVQRAQEVMQKLRYESEDAKEGARAFAEKRKPRWTGK